MYLNSDCVRDTLLYLEENLKVDFNHTEFYGLRVSEVVKLIAEQYNHSENDVWYTISQLHDAGFIAGKFQDVGTHKMIASYIETITWEGHQFLDSVRNKEAWEHVKSAASKIGGLSITGLGIAAKAYIQQIALNPNFLQGILS